MKRINQPRSQVLIKPTMTIKIIRYGTITNMPPNPNRDAWLLMKIRTTIAMMENKVFVNLRMSEPPGQGDIKC